MDCCSMQHAITLRCLLGPVGGEPRYLTLWLQCAHAVHSRSPCQTTLLGAVLCHPLYRSLTPLLSPSEVQLADPNLTGSRNAQAWSAIAATVAVKSTLSTRGAVIGRGDLPRWKTQHNDNDVRHSVHSESACW